MNFFLFVAAVLISTLLLGRLLEKIRVPWIFAALIIGAALAAYDPFKAVVSSDLFSFFSQLGMYLMLFLIGFELDIDQIKEKSGFIFRSTFFIIFLEGAFGLTLIHFVFGYSWLISALVALSFATVGEVILIPILQEFNMVNTTLGQSIIGIGTADDVIEIALLLVASLTVGTQLEGNIYIILGSLAVLILLTMSFRFFRKERVQFKFAGVETLFLFILFVFFLFIGIGNYAASAPLAAILAGVSIRLFIHDERLVFVEKELKALTYGLFAPLFFVWIGTELNINYLVSLPLLIVLVVLVSGGAKLLGSYIMGRKELGAKGSVLLGIGLSVRFSTSIIIIQFLYDNNIIGYDLFSVVIASSIVFPFIIPVLFSWLAVKWGFGKRVTEEALPEAA